MTSLFGLSLLIPGIPLFTTLFIAILLFSFNRTMNRLTKPVTFFLIFLVLVSTTLSFILGRYEVSGSLAELEANLLSFKLHLYFYIDGFIAKCLTLIGLLSLSIMSTSYYRLPRQNGYVRYFSLLGLATSLLFTFAIDGDFFKALISKADFLHFIV